MIEEIRKTVDAAQAGRLDHLVQTLTQRSRAEIRGLMHHDCVTLNGEVCAEGGRNVAEGDVVVIRHDPQRKYREPPRERSNSAFRLVYEDADLIVVDKAAAILTVPTDRGERNTLLDAVTRHLRRANPRARAYVVQRLDRGVSGLVVLAKNGESADGLQRQFKSHAAEREYVAIVAGKLQDDSGTFESRMTTSKSLQRYSVQDDSPGELAVTHWQAVKRLPGATLVRVRLETGRRNQIRVHFAEAGHPVLGDDRYRPEKSRHSRWKARRLALHAAVLGLVHPSTAAPLKFESPLPTEFETFLTPPRH